MFLNLGVKIGRMTADPQDGQSNGRKYARFTLAVGRPYLQEGNRPADFVDVVVFGDALTKIVMEGGRKGRLVAVVGEWRSKIREVGSDKTKVKEWTLHANTIRWLDSQGRAVEEHPAEQDANDPKIDTDYLPF